MESRRPAAAASAPVPTKRGPCPPPPFSPPPPPSSNHNTSATLSPPSPTAIRRLTSSVGRLGLLQSEGALRQMSEEEKRNYFLRLQRQKEEMESLLRALHPGPGREAVPVPEPEPEEEEQLYENTTMFAAKFIAEQQQQIVDDPPPPPLPPRAPTRRTIPTPPSKPSNQQRPANGKKSSCTSDPTSRRLEQDINQRERFKVELEEISNKIISLADPAATAADKYSADNEAERQRVELQAEHVRSQMTSRQQYQQSRQPAPIPPQRRMDHPQQQQQQQQQEQHQQHQQRPQYAPMERLLHDSAAGVVDRALSHSGPSGLNASMFNQEETSSVISFTSSIHSLPNNNSSRRREDIDSKIECVDSISALLGCRDVDLWSRKIEAMSATPANCEIMRDNRTAIEEILEILHGSQMSGSGNERNSREIRLRVSNALHNMVHAHPMDKQRKREAKVLRLIESLRCYADLLRDVKEAVESETGGATRPDLAAVLCHGCRPISVKLPPPSTAQSSPSAVESVLVICDIDSHEPSSTTGLRSGADRNVSSASVPCKNFINFSREGMLAADGSVVLSISIEQIMAVLTKCSFDDGHRRPITLLGGIRALADIIQVEKEVHGEDFQEHNSCSEIRRCAVVALTNLTFGNERIKSFLCASEGFIPVMLCNLQSPFENLRKATAHLFRNLAWKADRRSRKVLSDSDVVRTLLAAAMDAEARLETAKRSSGTEAQGEGKEETTLKIMLSALWNLSAHCSKNKADICSTEGTLEFLVRMLAQKSVPIVENGGGILRNISSYIAKCEEEEHYRSILRRHNCLSLLLSQLTSPSLIIVSNACLTLWNFSAHSAEDQRSLRQMGAVAQLKMLTNSKHRNIAVSAKGALKNLLGHHQKKQRQEEMRQDDETASPSLASRKQRAAMQQMNLEEEEDKILPLTESEGSNSGSDDDEVRDSVSNLSGGANRDGHCRNGNMKSESKVSLSSIRSISSVGALSDDPLFNRSRLEQGAETMNSNASFQEEERHSTRSVPTAGRQPLELSKSRKQIFLKSSQDLGGNGGGVSYHHRPQQEQHYHQRELDDYHRHNLQNFQPFQGFGQQQQRNQLLNNYVGAGDEAFNGERIRSPSTLESSGSYSQMQQEPPFLGQLSQEDRNGEPPRSDDDDQPRDFSGRFEHSDEDEDKPRDFSGRFTNSDEEESEVEEDEEEELEAVERKNGGDTVKTYCTEGTPLDTPYLISNATSLSDLREPDVTEGASAQALFVRRNKVSGVATPASERPKVFCTEDTPDYFSRADSPLSSIGSSERFVFQEEPERPEQHRGNNIDDVEEKGQLEASHSKDSSPLPPPVTGTPPSSAEQHPHQFPPNPQPRSVANNVRFSAQDTPLMFSRTSSLESLESCDQHSVRTGYSSNFTRATSGRVSPSDLPDSPCQTPPMERKMMQAMVAAIDAAKERARNAEGSFPPHAAATAAVETRGLASGGKQETEEDTTAANNAVTIAAKEAFSSSSHKSSEECVRVFHEEGTPDAIFSSKASSKASIADEYDNAENLDETCLDRPSTPEIAANSINNSELKLSPGVEVGNDLLTTSVIEEKNKEVEEEEEIYAESLSLMSRVHEKGMPRPIMGEAGSSIPLSSGRRSREGSGIPVMSAGRKSTSQLPIPRKLTLPSKQQEQVEEREDEDPDILDAVIQKGMRQKQRLKKQDDDPNIMDAVIQKGMRQKQRLKKQDDDPNLMDAVIQKGMKQKQREQGEEQEDEDIDILDAIIQKGVRMKQRSTPSILGQRVEGEGAPAPPKDSGARTRSKAPTKHRSTTDAMAKSRLPPPPPRRKGSALSPGGTAAAEKQQQHVFKASESSHKKARAIVAPQQHLQDRQKYSGGSEKGFHVDTPKLFATEGTPNTFSRSDSPLSVLSFGTIDVAESASADPVTASAIPSGESHQFRPYIPPSDPRPEASGRSDSTGSSTKSSCSARSGSNIRSNNNDCDSSSEEDNEEEDYMASCIKFGMLKSKSEPLNLRKTKSAVAAGSSSRVQRREGAKERRRSASKSPRNSKIVPGVRITELKLKPKPKSKEPSPEKQEDEEEEVGKVASSVFVRESPQGDQNDAQSDVKSDRRDIEYDGANEESMTETLTVSTARKQLFAPSASTDLASADLESAALLSSISSTLSSVQPPSMMESLISMNDRSSAPNTPPASRAKMECRHTLSGKKGFTVPAMVRRALGSDVKGSNEDLSSVSSSCQSNLDNIRPPTIMEDMDNSIVSIASLNSEVAADVRDHPQAVDSPSLAGKMGSLAEDGGLSAIDQPTLVDDLTLTSHTLVAPANGDGGATYTVDGGEIAEAGLSTCHDVTDAFDDDTTLGGPANASDSEAGAGTLPDLPRDSPRHATPGSSLENTPKRSFQYYEQYRVPTPNIDDSSEAKETSGYRSEETTMKCSSSSRQRRKEEVDRFKTHVITKSDLSNDSSPVLKKTSLARLLQEQDSGSDTSSSGSLRKTSLKQRREEEAERFKTQVITHSQLRPSDHTGTLLSPMEAKVLQEEANLVANAIKDQHQSAEQDACDAFHRRSNRSKSASIEPLDETEMTLTMEIESPQRKGPRVSKPDDSPTPRKEDSSEDEVAKVVRGRRRPLYATTPKRSTVPPAVAPKPTIAPKPRYLKSLSSPGGVKLATPASPPTQIRGTRASNLRQTQIQRRNSPPSSPRSIRSGYSSTSSCSSKTSSTRFSSRSAHSAKSAPALVRQGTFTKDDASSTSQEKTPPSSLPKPSSSIRKDVVHPAAASKPPLATKPRQTLQQGAQAVQYQNPQRTRIPSESRMRSIPAPPKFGQPRTTHLRERSLQRVGGTPTSAAAPAQTDSSGRSLQKNNPSTSSTASLASLRSSRSADCSVRTSSSSHNLRSDSTTSTVVPANASSTLGRRMPSSPSIDQKKKAWPAEEEKKPKKEVVTSKIASLWKRVEDSKYKGKTGSNNDKDPRVWITQGKVIPKSELELLRVDEEQKQIINNFQQAKKESSNEAKPPKAKSRLSLKLSKFSKSGTSKKDTTNKASLSSPTASCSTPASNNSAIVSQQDSLNGNLPAPIERQQVPSGEDNDDERGDEVSELLDEDGKAKRLSRLGSFFNPDSNNPTAAQQSSNNKPPASAIVPPFNYSPPVRSNHINEEHEEQDVLSSSSSSKPRSAQVKRNDSYVSSMGRKSKDDDPSPETPKRQKPPGKSVSASVMVTLV